MTTHGSLPHDKITKEIRFAVVMYGGISLAIYMNGIAQELLSMVRGTSPIGPNPDNLSDTAIVYRDIADYLSQTQNNGAFNHRFVVDIISGTSAGGINGICLAKALARGLDDLKTLENTWLSEGDIDYLLNDKKSEPKKYRPKAPLTSLFNSQRMYGKLLDAFHAMESSAKDERSHIDSMSLFVTATDLKGIQLPILLKDGNDMEKLYKHVFPFAFRSDKSCRIRQVNHFSGAFDSMLAFAARCTSSIPPAFEPVSIRDIKQYLEERSPKDLETWNRQSSENSGKSNWNDLFFNTYVGTNTTQYLEFREFADGGYLDNRPFGHAIQAIHTRETDCPVSRKLLYVDPKPEKIEEIEKPETVSFVQNLALASTALPRYETIRDEIVSIKLRNDWIESMEGIIKDMFEQNNDNLKKIVLDCFWQHQREIGMYNLSPENIELRLFFPYGILVRKNTTDGDASQEFIVPSPEPEIHAFWQYIAEKSLLSRERELNPNDYIKDFREMTDLFGAGYTSYHYTRLHELTNEISLIIIRAMNAEKQESLCAVVHHIIRLWRKSQYHSNRVGEKQDEQIENLFFRKYDIRFRIRRLNLFRLRVEKSIVKKSTKTLYFGLFNNPPSSEDPIFNMSDELANAVTVFFEKNAESLQSLYRLRALLLSSGIQNPLFKTAQKMREIIEERSKNLSLEKIEGIADFEKLSTLFSSSGKSGNAEDSEQLPDLIEHLMNALYDLARGGYVNDSCDCGTVTYEGTKDASDRVSKAMTTLGKSFPEIAGCMRYMYNYGYELHDMVVLPLMSGGEYGEGTPIDLYRMSPADATSLWNEQERKKSKLAGVALGSFGAFLDDEWRRNDIMWGRLDAAERIINILLPDDKDREMREKSIRRAQFAILDETTANWRDELDKHRFDSKNIRAKEQYNRIESIRKPIDTQLKLSQDYNGLEEMIEWKNIFCNQYDFHRDIEPRSNLKRLGRSSAIFSSMIQGIDEKNGAFSQISSLLKKMSWILLGMLDFSTPKSFKAIVAHYWLQLILFASILLVVVGLFIGNYSALKSAGTVLFRAGIVLTILDIGLLLLQYNLTQILHNPQKGSGFNKVKGSMIGLLAIIVFLVAIIAVINVHIANGTTGIINSISSTLTGIFK